MTFPTKAVVSPYTITFDSNGGLILLSFKGKILGRCLEAGIYNKADPGGTLLHVCAALYGTSGWGVEKDHAGKTIAVTYEKKNLPRVVPSSVSVDPHLDPDLNGIVEVLSFDVRGPFQIEINGPMISPSPQPYDPGSYLQINHNGDGATPQTPPPKFIQCFYPDVPKGQKQEAALAACECGAAATGSPRHSDYCPQGTK